MGPDDITPAWLSRVLDGEVGGVEAERIGDGLVGMNLRLRLTGATADLPPSLVVKLPSPDATSRATGVMLRNYEREVRFYTEVAHTVAIRVPRCYHGEWDIVSGDFVLLLEDMAPAVQGDQLTGCSVDHARLAVAELARLHGPRWEDPTLFDLDWLSRRTGPDDAAQLQVMWMLALPGFQHTYSGYLSAEQRELVERFGAVIGEWLDGRPPPMVVTHGDYRLDNLLFGTGEGSPPVTAVDWQTPGHGPPVADLAYFVGAGLTPADRRVHERALIDVYLHGLDGFGVRADGDWLWREFRRETFAGVVMAVIASQIVGRSERSEAMFAAMAARHAQHAIDLGSLQLV